MNDNTSLKVRKGTQVFGPMTLVQVAELLASGRITESDEVSADGRTWHSITSFFEQQQEEQSPPPAEEPAAIMGDAKDADSFLPVFSDVDSSPEPSYTFLEDDVDEPEAVDDADEPIPAVMPQKGRKRPKRKRRIDPEEDAEDDSEIDEEPSNLNEFFRDMVETELTALKSNEGRDRPKSGGAKSKAPPLKLTAEERREGFVMLFNGRNFSGWRFRESSAMPEKLPDNWKAERGCIRLTGGGKPALMSQWDYQDFDLRFVWRTSEKQYNSSLCLRSDRKVSSNQICLRQGVEGTFRGGTIKGATNANKLQRPFGEWNEWRVLADGDKLTLWCNGKKAWVATGFEPEDGYIGFLAAGAQFEFTNLRIKELGFEYLNDLKTHWSPADDQKNRWKQMGDSIVGVKGETAPIETVHSEYQDFVLRLDWKLTKSATGTLYLRGADCEEASVGLGGVDEGSGGLPAIHVRPSDKLDNPNGQWNFMEVRLLNNVITVRLNGEEVVQKAKLPRGASSLSSGPIALSHNGRPIQVRNIRIRRLNEAGSKKSKWLGGSLFGRKSE
jgi:hypothetical protein